MPDFIKAEDGSYVNVDHIYDIVPIDGGPRYVVHYAGVDECGDPASAIIPASVVRRLVAPQPREPKATVD